MGNLQAESDLAQMLSEAGESAERRVKASGDLQASQLVLYGAGTLGQTTLTRLRRLGIEPVAFADDTPDKQGRTISGLRVMKPLDAVAQFGGGTVFVVTILNPFSSFLAVERRLRQVTNTRVISFLHLAWAYPEEFLPHYQFDLPHHLLSQAEEIKRALRLFADDKSRDQFLAHIRFRLYLDYGALPASSRGDYFPPDVLAPLPPEITFVDCGAYDGDTVRQFFRHQGDAFERVYAFEPDKTNCQRLQQSVDALGENVARRVRVCQAGVGAQRARLRFHSTGNSDAAFGAGDEEVDVWPLQDVIEQCDGPLYIKLDVEGAEHEALSGADQLIRRARPIIALSVYHRPDDLWQLPLYLHSLDLGYELFLRTQGEDGMDIVCYAVQPHQRSTPAVRENHG